MARRVGMHFKFNLGRTKGRGHKQPSVVSGVPMPRITIDLTADTATNEGASVAIDTLLGTDAATANYWYPSAYRPENRTSAGLAEDRLHSPALIGDAKTLALAGSTIVVEYLITDEFDGGNGPPGIYIVNEPASNYVQVAISANGNIQASSSGDFFGGFGSGTFTKDADGIVNRLAATLTPTKGALSANGLDVDSHDISTEWPTTDSPYAWLRLAPGVILRKVSIYDPVDDAALPALSAV